MLGNNQAQRADCSNIALMDWKPDGLSDNEVLSGKGLFLKANILTYLALWNVDISVTTFMRWCVVL